MIRFALARFVGRLSAIWRNRAVGHEVKAQETGESGRAFVVVTGGSEGIGLAIAGTFVELGHDVMIVARSAERLKRARNELAAMRPGANVVTCALDASGGDACAVLDAELARHGGYCDVLVNNAAVGMSGAFVSHSPSEIDQLNELNVTALVRLTRHFLPAMLSRGRGGVLSIASIAGYVPGPWQTAYYASKAYVISFSEGLAREVSGRGVRICVVAPGPTSTRFHAKMGARGAFYLLAPWKMSSRAIARSAVAGFLAGQRVVVPGLVQKMNVVALRLLPRTLTVPLLAWLLRPRGRGLCNSKTGEGTRRVPD